MYTSYSCVAITFVTRGKITCINGRKKPKTLYALSHASAKSNFVILIQAVGDLERKGLLAAIA